jgi:hypothetical protein
LRNADERATAAAYGDFGGGFAKLSDGEESGGETLDFDQSGRVGN